MLVLKRLDVIFDLSHPTLDLAECLTRNATHLVPAQLQRGETLAGGDSIGLGEDGHTASLFPGAPAVREGERRAIATRAPVGVPDRITLSAAYMNRARLVWFLVTGAGKAQALARVLAGLPLENLPAGAAGQVGEMQIAQLAALQARADAGQEDPARVARSILRIVPRTCDDLHAWAERHVDGLWQPEAVLPGDTGSTLLLADAAGDDERQALYTRACLALSTGDRAQARQLLGQLGSYRAAQRLLQNMEE